MWVLLSYMEPMVWPLHSFIFWVHLAACAGEGNGNPLQCSCLENPRDRGAWWAAVYGVAQSWTRLKWLSSSSSMWDLSSQTTGPTFTPWIGSMESCDYGLDLILKDTGLGDSIDRMLRKWFTIKKPTRDFFFIYINKSNTLIHNIKYFLSPEYLWLTIIGISRFTPNS